MEWTVAVGVDTHKDVHVAVALDAVGAQLDSQEIPTTAAGYRRLLSWARELGVPVFAVEGTGSYGAGLVRFLKRADVAVYECERPRRQERRGGKNDLIDAALAARRLLAGEGRVCLAGMVDARTCACSCSNVAAPCRRAPPPSTN
jgi:transposase